MQSRIDYRAKLYNSSSHSNLSLQKSLKNLRNEGEEGTDPDLYKFAKPRLFSQASEKDCREENKENIYRTFEQTAQLEVIEEVQNAIE